MNNVYIFFLYCSFYANIHYRYLDLILVNKLGLADHDKVQYILNDAIPDTTEKVASFHCTIKICQDKTQ